MFKLAKRIFGIEITAADGEEDVSVAHRIHSLVIIAPGRPHESSTTTRDTLAWVPTVLLVDTTWVM